MATIVRSMNVLRYFSRKNNIMTETEFVERAEALFAGIETALDAAGADVETDRSGNVLTIEADSGEEAVVNLHTPTQQVWLASRKGGLHFSYDNGRWISTRDGRDFWDALSEAVSFITGESVAVKALAGL